MIRVMLVDDEEDALDLLEILLQQIGDVKVVGWYLDPLRAIEALQTTPVDAVFLDIQMPGLIGTEAARKIQKMAPHALIVFTTAYSEYAVEAFEIQSIDYLLKPFTLDRLQKSILRMKNVLSEHQAVSNIRIRPYIQSLGGFHIYLPNAENKLLSWRTNKEKEICAFLIHHEGKPVDTSVIIESIWPEYDLKKAKTYLYTCLSYLRKSLHENGIQANVNKVGNGFAISLEGLDSDAAQFEGMLAKVLSGESADEQLYDKINDLYKGEYLEGCDYSWAAAKQAGIKARYMRALHKMYEYFRQRGSVPLAVDSLQRVLAIMPDSEEDGRELIRLHMKTGKRNEALKVYRQMEQAVHIHMDAELEEETVQLYRQIFANR